MNIVLVHGFFDSARKMSRLACELSAAGHTCFAPPLKPSDGRSGLELLARQLDDYIGSILPRGTRLVLVGFSMGAVVCRCYLQLLGGYQRTDAFFSIAGPHGGTLMAYFYPGRGAREMRPGSSLIKKLEATADRLSGIPVVSYWCPMDTMIVPGSSARMAGADQIRLVWGIHAALPFDRRIHRDIKERLKATAPNQATGFRRCSSTRSDDT